MFDKSYIIAHRGLHNNIDIYENTLEAFKLAIEKEYIIELDVRLTKDKQIVVFHDSNIKRITKTSMVIEKSTYQELNNQNIVHIPLLSEVLSLVNSKVPILIEIKSSNVVEELLPLIMNILNKYKGEYAIQSFNPKILYWFKRNYPNVLRGQLSKRYNKEKISSIKKFILTNMYLNIITKPHFISYKYNELSLDKINKYKKKNIRIIGWTITNKKELEHYKKYYDNLIYEESI